MSIILRFKCYTTLQVPANHNKSTLSVSLVHYDTANEGLIAVIESLLSALEGCASILNGRTIIAIVDNEERQSLELRLFSELQERLKTNNCELQLIQGQGNVGYGKGHNLALAKMKSDYVLLMNPDVNLDKNSLTEGLRYMEGHDEVAAVCPSAVFPDGIKQYLCKRYPSVFDFLLRSFMPISITRYFADRLAAYEMRELSEEKATQDIPIISGCFMLCRRDALHQVGGFNEDYFLYFEDFDLCMRLRQQYKLAYLPEMKIVHHGGHTAKKGLLHIGMFVRSSIRFFSTHGWRWY
ncbi:MAG: glycosyltransferase family 2 protein [Gammaproteobacteria bacterium]|nr:glycosyltransferase family 2 protein [Gammaproteobacteria bacterium]